MSVVLDEYAGVVGIITLNDLVEELVGELHEDCAGTSTEEPHIEQMNEKTWRVIGNVELRDIERALEVEIGQEDVETFSGLVFNELGCIPDDGDQNIELRFRGLHIRISHIEEHQITRAQITKLERPESDSKTP